MSNQKNSGTKAAAIQFTESDELLDIRYDHIFKAVFTRDTPASKGALSGLISALIERKIIVQTIIANEPPINNTFDRRIRFDIACKAESGEMINIEMSFNPDTHEPVRLEYYASRQFSGQGIHGIGKSYADLVETFQIMILGTENFFPDDDLVHTFFYYDPIHRIPLGGKSRIITVELLKSDKIVDKPTTEMGLSEKWSIFFQYLTNKNKRAKINEILEKEEGIAMAGETLIHISRNEIEQARLTSELKYILDTQSKYVDGQRAGHAEGREERSIEIAKNALAKGIPIETIHEITGLTIETIVNLK
jgi:predicted transposase/invertase (TIGR01784 family)